MNNNPFIASSSSFTNKNIMNKLNENVNEAVRTAKNRSSKLELKDMISIFIVGALLPIGFIFEITFVLSFWHSIFSGGWLLRVLPLLYLGFNLYTNIYKLITVGPNGRNSELPSVIKPGYKYCHICNLNTPPRSHHCPVCNSCIFRRDHHCSFAATCVGHFNQRYFVAAILNLWFVAMVCFVWNFGYLSITMKHLELSQIWHIMLPHLALIFGFISLAQFFSIFVFVSSVVTLLFVTYMISAQFFCFFRGQTRVEYLLNMNAYNLGFIQNIEEALGERWPLVFLSAFISSPPHSDGLSFRTRELGNVNKSTKIF